MHRMLVDRKSAREMLGTLRVHLVQGFDGDIENLKRGVGVFDREYSHREVRVLHAVESGI